MKIKVLGFYKGGFVSGTYWFGEKDRWALNELRTHFKGLIYKIKE